MIVRLGALVLLAWAWGFVWFALTLAPPAPLASKTDGVVVLTGGAGRLQRGVDVLVAGSAQRMLVSGVERRVTDAALAHEVNAPAGLFGRDVDLGFEAIDTRSNAEETAAWVRRHKYSSLRLVTSAAHMRRARLELDGRLPSAVAIVPDGVDGENSVTGLLREYNKLALRFVARGLGVQ
ncbi:YdcF family protein [Sphingosinicellaceae bacterium]|nr:YdcF family protein [Sphingosinicellaceae bacterium]